MKLILVRHGESIGNQENRLQGQHDYELTELGQRQALLTGQRLAREGVTRVYTSPLLRASATAKTIAEVIGGLEPLHLPDIAEYHFGDMSGQTYAEVRKHFTGSTALSQPPPGPPPERVYPGEEGRDNFFNRVTLALKEVIERHSEESVAVVSHGGPIALFCQSVLGLPYSRPMPFSIDNCSLTVIQYDPSERDYTALLLSLNDVCHLDALRHRDD